LTAREIGRNKIIMHRLDSGPGEATVPGKPAHALRLFLLLALFVCLVGCPARVLAQDGATATPAPEDTPLEAPERVDVQPVARDEEIRERLQNILEATGWFENPEVQVQDGVVFLAGQTDTAERKQWAGDLARSTQDVAAVVNQIALIEPSVWNFDPALAGIRELWRDLLQALPILGFSAVILVIALFVARLTIMATRASVRKRITTPLLVNVIARAAGVAVFLVGLYVIFYVSGLTNVALTVLGGTGLLGLVLGIAFRDITENFLASIFLSLQSPFQRGDLVEIDGILGFVQMLTTRTTILMTQSGNHVQIPNATVYKSNIVNYTSNPNRREGFIVGIGYDDSATAAQELALQVLAEHPTVLQDPEPLVLLESLGASSVNLRIYFWLDGTQHSWLKVRSSVIRLVKRAFQDAGISMPGEVRELVFSQDLSVELLEPEAESGKGVRRHRPGVHRPGEESEAVYTEAEGGLRSEAEEIEEQARRSRPPEEGEDLLETPSEA
jgi:small-conductance mechanosensitive channel